MLLESNRRGKKSAITIIAEGAGDSTNVTRELREKTGFEVRLTRLGHVQRGRHSTALSRLLACEMGAASIQFLLDGKRKHMTGIQGDCIVPVDLEWLRGARNIVAELENQNRAQPPPQ